MEKSLAYYKSLDYPVVIKEIPEDQGGGYTAYIPVLGSHAYVGDGDSIKEALQSLAEIKVLLFEEALKKGVHIPEPEQYESDDCSGKFLVRVPKDVHKSLKVRAKREGVSLNHYCSTQLTKAAVLDEMRSELQRIASEVTNISNFVLNQNGSG